jgi:hypothetical protein
MDDDDFLSNDLHDLSDFESQFSEESHVDSSADEAAPTPPDDGAYPERDRQIERLASAVIPVHEFVANSPIRNGPLEYPLDSVPPSGVSQSVDPETVTYPTDEKTSPEDSVQPRRSLDPERLRHLIDQSPILRTRSNGNGTVETRLHSIIGDQIRQNELKALREGLFTEILPEITRDEKRTRSAHLKVFESHRAEVLPFLEKPEVIAAVVEAVLTSRYNRNRDNDVYKVVEHLGIK